jgi:hypothetical protein
VLARKRAARGCRETGDDERTEEKKRLQLFDKTVNYGISQERCHGDEKDNNVNINIALKW